MMKKLATIDLKGKAYATVPTRIKEFREVCPNGLIETKPTFNDVGVVFNTRILKDKSNANSGEGTGHSFATHEAFKDPKAFEKLETISVGRALAMLGFMASGDVASFEEMEEFLSEKETKRQLKIQEIKEKVDGITDIDELRTYFKENRGNGVEVDDYITARSEQLKTKK